LRKHTIEIVKLHHVVLHSGNIFADLFCRCGQLRLTASSDEDVGAFFDKFLGRGKADTAIATCDERNFSYKLMRILLGVSF